MRDAPGDDLEARLADETPMDGAANAARYQEVGLTVSNLGAAPGTALRSNFAYTPGS